MNAHVEREYRYLVERPTPETLNGYPHRDITQIYLPHGENEDSRRVRKTVENGTTRYFYTAKKRVSYAENIEREEEITAADYATLSARGVGRTIEKRRYLIPHGGVTFELDLYEFARNVAILEAETELPEAEVLLPPFLKPIRNVTDDKAYSNAALSRGLPDDFR